MGQRVCGSGSEWRRYEGRAEREERDGSPDPEWARGRPALFAITVGLELQRRLGAAPMVAHARFETVELSRTEVPARLAAAPALRRSLASLDAAAPSGWRCFVALAAGTPIHVSFVATRPGRPILFGAITEPAARGCDAFRATVARIDQRLRAAGESTLYSSVDVMNHRSVRAHLAAGFAITRRVPDILMRGYSLRRIARAVAADLFDAWIPKCPFG